MAPALSGLDFWYQLVCLAGFGFPEDSYFPGPNHRCGVFGPAIGAKLVLGKSFKELLASIGSARKRTVHLLILTILYTLSANFGARSCLVLAFSGLP